MAFSSAEGRGEKGTENANQQADENIPSNISGMLGTEITWALKLQRNRL